MFEYHFKAKFWSPVLDDTKTIKFKISSSDTYTPDIFNAAIKTAYEEIYDDRYDWDLIKITLKNTGLKEEE